MTVDTCFHVTTCLFRPNGMVGTLSVYEIEYANPCNGKNMPVMLRTDYDEEVVKLLDAVGPKPCPPIWVTSLRKTGGEGKPDA